MKHRKLFCLSLVLGFLISMSVYGQERESEINIEESAEVFLEEYSDEFQENFFEALKQKGIENYDRAINYLLECKRLDADNVVIDHELAKTYLADKKYNLAQDYAIAALISEPENLWYLDTLIEALDKQGNTFESLEMAILSDNFKLQESLAVVYFRKSQYDKALAVIENLKKTPFLDDLASKINDSLEKKAKKSKKMTFSVTNTNRSEGVTTLNGFKGRIQGLIRSNNHMILKQVSEDALENFPSQPYFYYVQGYALNKTGKYRDAVEVLEASLDYLVGDIALANKIYTELVEAYNGINNSVKANMYLRKIKPGF